MEKKQNVPALRFQGFSGEWESHYLGMLGVTFSGLSGKTKADFGHGKARFVPYLNVFNHPIADLQETEAIEIDDKQNEVKYGDIFFTTSSETPEEVGMSSVWLGNEKNVYLNSFCFGYRPTSTLYPFFMAFLLRSSSVRKEFVFLAQGISRYNISKNKAMGIGISVPLFREQCKIGDFFQNLDKFIDGQSHKIQKLQQFRQAMLAKLFPRKGAAEPELRFRGFSGEWASKSFEKLFDMLPTNTLSRSNLNNKCGEIRNVHYGDILVKYNDLIDVKHKDLPFITRNIEVKMNALLKDGDIIIADTAEDMTAGKCVEMVNVGEEKVVSGLHTIACRPLEFFAPGFLGYFFNSHLYHDQLIPLMQGVKVTSISKTALKSTVIYFPSEIEEQKRIGQFFMKLDSYISLQQKKLERMQRLKAAQLDKMFV